MDLLVLLAVLGSVPAYVVLQIVALIVARFEGWRLAFAAPLVLSVPLGAWCLLALLNDSNLWPLLFILFAPFGTGYLLVVLMLRAILPLRRPAAD